MSEPAVLSARLIGEIFVERGLVTHEQLEEALIVQQRTGAMIGEVLVSSFGVSRIELASVLAEQWTAMERGTDADRRPVQTPVPPVRLVESPDETDTESKRPLGEIFVERGMATEEQLEEALRIQRESGERLGEILVRMGAIQRLDLAGALAEQWSGLQKLRPPEPKPVEAWHDLAARPAGADATTNGSTDLPVLQEAVSSIQKQLAALASRPDPDLTTLRAETRAVEQRLAGMEDRLDGLATAEELADLAGAVERLAVAATDRGADDLASVVADLGERVAALAADTTLADRITGLEQLQAGETVALRDALAGLQEEISQVARIGDLDALRARLDETAPGSLGSRVDEIAADLERLARLAEEAGRPTADPQLDARITEARKALLGLSDRLGTLDDRLDRIEARGGADQELVQALEGRVAGAVERAELDELVSGLEERLGLADDALRDLAEIRAELAARPTRDELATPLADLAAQIDVLASPEAGRDAETVAVVAALAARLDALEPVALAAAGRSEVVALGDELRERLQEIRRELESADVDERVVAAVDAVEALRSRLDGLAARSEVDDVGHRLDARLDEVRALVESSTVEDALSDLRLVVDELVSRADRAVARDELDRLQLRLDELIGRSEVESLAAALEVRLDEVRSLVDASGDADERLSSLADAVDELRARVNESVERPELATIASELRNGLDELRRRADPTAQEDRVTALVDGVAELRSYLGVLQGRLDGAIVRGDLDELASRLGSRIDELRVLVDSSAFESELADLRGVVDELGARAGRAVERDELDRLRVRVDELVGAAELETLAVELRGRIDELRAVVDASAGDDERLTSLDDTMSDLRADLDALGGRLAGTIGRTDVDELVAPLAAAVGELRTLVESAQVEDRVVPVELAIEELRATVTGLSSHVDEAVDRTELASLWERVGDLVSRPEVAALAGDLGARVDEARALAESLHADDRITPVEGAVGELRDAVGELRSRAEGAARREQLDGLAGELGVLRERLEGADLEGRVAPVEGAVAELRGWLEAVQGRLDGLVERAEVESVVEQLDALRVRAEAAVGRPELVALAGDLGSRVEELRGLVESLQEDRVAPVEGAVTDLRGWLGAVQGRLAGLAERAEVDGLVGALGQRLDELAAVADLRLVELAGRDDELAHGADLVAGRVDGLADELTETLTALRAELDERLAGLASRKRLDRVEGELVGRITGLEQRAADAAPSAALDALGGELHQRLAMLDAVARDAAEQAAGAPELAARIVHESLGDVVGRHELASLAGDLDARIVAAAASGADVSAQLAAGLDAIAVELRDGLAHLHGRIDELAAGLGHTGGRLAAVEQTAASAASVEDLAAVVADVRATVEIESSLSTERARETERAIRKGLASLGERLVAGEQAYLEAGASLRRSIERLGAAVVEVDARIDGEPLDPPGVGYVAFVPTVDGYRLRPLDGPAPAVGELVELGPEEPAMRVGRVTTSPLPLDRRPCVYLENV